MIRIEPSLTKLIDIIQHADLHIAQDVFKSVIDITERMNHSFVVEYTTNMQLDSRRDMEYALSGIHPLLCRNREFLEYVEEL